MRNRISNCFLLALVLFIGGTLSSQNCKALEVAFENSSDLPIVYLNVVIKEGSVTDPIGQSGLTNFMGEMLIRGTQSKTKEQIALALDQMGAKLEVETRAEALILRGAVLSSQLDTYLKLLTEIITTPSFPPNEIKSLKSEVTSAIQEELGHDSTLASRRFTRFLFQQHAYGKPVMGKVKDIENLTQIQISTHYKRLVQDKLLLIVGTGDASSNKISEWGKELAQLRPNLKLPAPDAKILERVSAPEDSDHRRLLIVDKPDRTQTQIDVGQIGVRMTDKDFFPLHLGNHAFGGPSFSAMLMVEIRVKRGWSYGAGARFRHGLQPRSWHLHLFPAEKDTAPALAYSVKMVEDLREKGINSDQFEFAKRSLINSAGFMYNTPKKRVENKLLERSLDLPDGFMKSFASELQKVQLSNVNNAFKKFLRPGRMAISVLGTAKNLKESLSKAAGVPLDQVEVVPYTTEQ